VFSTIEIVLCREFVILQTAFFCHEKEFRSLTMTMIFNVKFLQSGFAGVGRAMANVSETLNLRACERLSLGLISTPIHHLRIDLCPFCFKESNN
jgi:hypothetical protein